MKLVKAHVKNLRASTIIGAYDWEKKQVQNVLMDIEVEYDAKKAIETDDVKNTFDYCELSQEIIKKTEETKFELLEKLVDFVADIIMAHEMPVSCKVEINKIDPVKDFADAVSITVERRR